MQCVLLVPEGTDVAAIQAEYPDMDLVETVAGEDYYLIGRPDEDGEESGPWLTYEEAVEFCGFCEGAVPGADAAIEGNGPWAQDMLRRRDFSGYAISVHDLAERMRCSNLWHAAFERGRATK